MSIPEITKEQRELALKAWHMSGNIRDLFGSFEALIRSIYWAGYHDGEKDHCKNGHSRVCEDEGRGKMSR